MLKVLKSVKTVNILFHAVKLWVIGVVQTQIPSCQVLSDTWVMGVIHISRITSIHAEKYPDI